MITARDSTVWAIFKTRAVSSHPIAGNGFFRSTYFNDGRYMLIYYSDIGDRPGVTVTVLNK